jgi:hypothetical protein
VGWLPLIVGTHPEITDKKTGRLLEEEGDMGEAINNDRSLEKILTMHLIAVIRNS